MGAIRSSWIPTFQVAAAAVCWSSGAVLIKLINFSGMETAFLRSLYGALFLLLFTRRLPRGITVFQLIGGAAYAVTSISFILANKLTLAANVVLLQHTAPVYVLIMALFLWRSYPRRGEVAAILIALVGLVFILAGDLSPGGFSGNLLALLSGLGLAVYIVALKYDSADSRLNSTVIGNCMILLVTLPWAANVMIPAMDHIWALLLGLVHFAVPFMLFTWGVRRISALEASLLKFIEPVLVPIWAAIILGETIGFPTISGGLIILAGLAINSVAGAVRS